LDGKGKCRKLTTVTASPPLTDIEEGGEKGREKGEKGKEGSKE